MRPRPYSSIWPPAPLIQLREELEPRECSSPGLVPSSSGDSKRLEGFRAPESHHSWLPPVPRTPSSCAQEATTGKGDQQRTGLEYDRLSAVPLTLTCRTGPRQGQGAHLPAHKGGSRAGHCACHALSKWRKGGWTDECMHAYMHARIDERMDRQTDGFMNG